MGILTDSCSQSGIRSLGGRWSGYRYCEAELAMKVKDGKEGHDGSAHGGWCFLKGPRASARPSLSLNKAFKTENSCITRILVLTTVLSSNQISQGGNMKSRSGG